ncbi:hypothetical protein [Nocardioides lijunqiniae]|uniref:hypothetical protein n=1 Tax=Nocardioides lijunqiniae TaxID=2760832 RepID=UPI001878DD0F|nr:hypothetical protein [Nocardioides lijunqiniae]
MPEPRESVLARRLRRRPVVVPQHALDVVPAGGPRPPRRPRAPRPARSRREWLQLGYHTVLLGAFLMDGYLFLFTANELPWSAIGTVASMALLVEFLLSLRSKPAPLE